MILEQILEQPSFLSNREDNIKQHSKSWNGEHTFVRFGKYVNPRAQMGAFANGGIGNVREPAFGRTNNDLVIVPHKEITIKDPEPYYTPPSVEAANTSLKALDSIKLIDAHDTYKIDRYDNLYSQHTTIGVLDEVDQYRKLSIALEKQAEEFKLYDSLTTMKHYDFLKATRKK